ncbi:hypothetical protein SERLA73DRAFT_191485 [Serpula lacrymans var. lacrymans S7.3]|uniref:Uncharacterized protein n=2 Tax=Serpula lacrymans var. lacrymans TaxID=341189 RepID=F8QHP1_SERL3|nr:uncharacterized protein SERLADRAFT_463933 [Serpula lacrymans var. lacrymans S7.9]EGN92153.1 hypothetical protein SERLA73DRAFT_191485 [Serpula lacrymans var. lacrymans S7.3]EGO26660.1 hypothetical protein SERLADRAFT_463933 [Serpula lacrymans var. lacrymans S7.9]
MDEHAVYIRLRIRPLGRKPKIRVVAVQLPHRQRQEQYRPKRYFRMDHIDRLLACEGDGRELEEE